MQHPATPLIASFVFLTGKRYPAVAAGRDRQLWVGSTAEGRPHILRAEFQPLDLEMADGR